MPNTTEQSSAPPATARAAALMRITERARRFPRFDPPTEGENTWVDRLPSAERSLAIGIDQACARHWLTLVALLEPCLSRPWVQVEPRVQAALLTGAAQLIYLDSVPDYAAISETVSCTKKMIRPGAGKLVNAVLRRISERQETLVDRFDADATDQLPLADGRAWALQPGTLPVDPIERIAMQSGCRPWMVQQWVQQFGHATAHDVAMHALVHAPLIITGSDSPPSDIATRAHDQPGYFVVEHGSGEKFRAALHALLQPDQPWRVQDPGTGAAIGLASQLTPQLIVDYCAGRGTKTRQLRALHPHAQIIATDVNDTRRAALHAAFADDERITVIEPADRLEYASRADLLVLDVPCSNSGVLARRVEARYRVTERDLEQLVDTQRQILADTLPLLAEDGHLLYITCSIDDRENVEQVEWITRWHRMPCAQSHRALPAGQPGEMPTSYRDGGFAALLSRAV